jgi:hypothetical protein
MRVAPLFVFVLLAWSQQTAPVMQNQGAMRLPFRCTLEDMDLAGMACSEEEPCPVYLELASVESVGNKIFAAGNLHGSSNTLYSVLLVSDDAGKTWREGFGRVRGATLDHIQFIDFETGWISGGIVFPLPQDPFFLITSDGGKTWRRRPVYSESRFGSIQQFWFSSKNNGSMTIDRGQSGEGSRYELYESPNSGDTWLVRQSSERPLATKRAMAPPAAWRAHADAASKSFRIERGGAGGTWTSVAAFLVSVGECKPQPAAEAPAPAPESPETKPDEPAGPPRRTPPTLKRKPR